MLALERAASPIPAGANRELFAVSLPTQNSSGADPSVLRGLGTQRDLLGWSRRPAALLASRDVLCFVGMRRYLATGQEASTLGAQDKSVLELGLQTILGIATL
jgi:hypothetical protein